MTTTPAELNQLLQSIDDGLQDIQASFDAYQNACFVARTPEFFCLELNGEAGELANLEKKVWKGRAVDPASLADEAADVLISLMNYANARGINLRQAVNGKLKRIEERRQSVVEQGSHY